MSYISINEGRICTKREIPKIESQTIYDATKVLYVCTKEQGL